MRNLFVVILSLAATFCWGQSYIFSNASVSVKGTSNLHDWESVTKEVRAKAQAEVSDAGLSSLTALWVEIPVKSIKSPKGSIMDGKTYDALKANKFPNIVFNLEKASITPKSGYFDVNATGNLTIAGVTKKVSLYAKGKVNGAELSFSGSKKMKMTDFGIDPPTALMGTLTTGDDIEVVYSLILKKG